MLHVDDTSSVNNTPAVHKRDECLLTKVERVLECPICQQVKGNAIYQCVNGHLVCNSCAAMISACAVCREPFPEKRIRCLLAEQIVHDLDVPMDCAWGCGVRVKNSEKSGHAKACLHRTRLCPWQPCSEVVRQCDLLAHAAQHHHDDPRVLDLRNEPLSITPVGLEFPLLLHMRADCSVLLHKQRINQVVTLFAENVTVPDGARGNGVQLTLSGDAVRYDFQMKAAYPVENVEIELAQNLFAGVFDWTFMVGSLPS
tara:strand:- start:2760 stop:3527 length:768 start_codon:yes stop_codon:yes gene_type:complete